MGASGPGGEAAAGSGPGRPRPGLRVASLASQPPIVAPEWDASLAGSGKSKLKNPSMNELGVVPAGGEVMSRGQPARPCWERVRLIDGWGLGEMVVFHSVPHAPSLPFHKQSVHTSEPNVCWRRWGTGLDSWNIIFPAAGLWNVG